MNFFAVFLRKLEPSCKMGVYSAAIFRKVLYRKWPPLPLFCHSIMRYLRISCLQRGVDPRIGEAFVCFAEEVNSHDRKAVISPSHDISYRNIAFEPSSGANTIVKHCCRVVYNQRSALAEIRGFAEL